MYRKRMAVALLAGAFLICGTQALPAGTAALSCAPASRCANTRSGQLARRGAPEKEGLRQAEAGFTDASLLDIVRLFLPLGFTAFGGPAAHIGLFEKIICQQLKWLPQHVFLELFALAQCLPGPASTQVAISVGTLKAGVWGGLVAGLSFILPGMMGLTALGILLHRVSATADSREFKGFCTGVSAAGVALVARAALSVSRATCPTQVLQMVNGVSATIAYSHGKPSTFPVLILLGAITGLLTAPTSSAMAEVPQSVSPRAGRQCPNGSESRADGIASYGLSRVAATFALAACAVLLAASWAVLGQHQVFGRSGGLVWFATFFRAGCLILGGGQVLLPLLMSELIHYVSHCNVEAKTKCERVPDYVLLKSRQLSHSSVRSWLREDEFLTGLGLSQGFPGPLFNLSAYLGAVIASRSSLHPVLGALVCWLGLFAPAFLLIFGGLPWWGQIRALETYKKAMPGMNAAAAGLVVAAVFSLYDKVRLNSPVPDETVAMGMLTFVAVEVLHVAPPMAVLLSGLAASLRSVLLLDGLAHGMARCAWSE